MQTPSFLQGLQLKGINWKWDIVFSSKKGGGGEFKVCLEDNINCSQCWLSPNIIGCTPSRMKLKLRLFGAKKREHWLHDLIFVLIEW